MKNLIIYLYRKTPPVLIRQVPHNSLLRKIVTFLMNRTYSDFGTRVSFVPGAFQVRKGDNVLRVKPSNWIYVLTLCKDFDNYFDCVVPTREGMLNVVDYSREGLQKFRISGLEFEVSGFPEEERVIVDYFKWHRPEPGETVFDLGANCGLSVYYLSQCVGPKGKVYAFEPDSINFAVLLRNIERHKMSNVVALRKAISAKTGQLKFYSEGTIGATLAHHSTHPVVGSVDVVEALSLADACAQYGVPGFIKVDIEGSEIDALAGSSEFLRAHSIHFAIDTSHTVDGQLTKEPVERILRDSGYEVLSSDETGMMTTWARKTGVEA